MTVDLRPYPEYKDSGLPWLGQVPVHWSIVRTKQLFRLTIDKSPEQHGMELLSIYTHIGVRPRKDLEERGNKATTTDGYWIVKKGDIIVNKLLAWMGAVGVSHYEGVTSPAYDILRPVRLLKPDFYHYLFRTGTYLQQFKRRSRGIMEMRLRLYFDQLGQIPVVLPPEQEQDSIVRFLDAHTRLMTRFIRNRRRLIGAVNEQKQAIIKQAVTRGLDPNVPLKPSGIDWLGDIPEHWETNRLRNLVELRVSNVDKHSKDGELPVRLCNYTDVYKNSAITAEMPFMAATASRDEIAAFNIRVGDVIITKDSEDWQDIGVPAVVAQTADDLICGYHLAILRPRASLIIGRFLAFAMQGRSVATQLNIAAKGVTRYGLSQGAIKSLGLAVPPLEEQEKIVLYIDEATASLNELVRRAKREIDLIREYRTRLIADVVTGKVDVRHLAPSPEVMVAEATPEDLDESLDDEMIGEDEADLAEEEADADD